MRIEFARGDSYARGISVKDRNTGETITEPFTEIYFTVKKQWSNEDYVLQKRLSTGGIVNDSEGHYVLNIAPEDTEQMGFGEYDFDFEFVRPGFRKTVCGTMKLTREVTHKNNE